MKKRSIGFRLAAWYFLVLGSGLAAFSVVAWYAARASIDHAIDDELRDRVRGVAKSDAFRRSILLWIGPDQLHPVPASGPCLLARTDRRPEEYRLSQFQFPCPIPK